MSRPARTAAAIGALALAVTSCAGSAPSPQPVTASPEAIAWVDQVCGALRPFAEHIAAGPQAGDASDASAAVAGLGSFVEVGATTLDGTLSGLAGIGPSPVAGGDAILDRMEADLTQQQTALREAGTRLAAVDVTDEATLATALPAALEGLPAEFDPTAELRTDPELSVAVDGAEGCRTLPTATG